MLPLPNLDDRRYEQIVEEARRMIPKIFPRWSDENVHDPGITLIELFAWLTEMQQYYLNRITRKSEFKFLKLLGVAPKPPALARTEVRFSGMTDRLLVPPGTKLLAKEQIFETEEPLWLVPSRLEKVIVQEETLSQDFTATNSHEGVSWYAFGQEPVKGNRFYAGFDRPFLQGQEMVLTLEMFEDYPVSRNEIPQDRLDEWVPSAKVRWYYYGRDREREGWHPLEMISDGTLHLSRGGRVRFTIPGEMKPFHVHPASDRTRYWVCCTLEEGTYELPPRLEHIALHSVTAVNRDTRSRVFEFDGNGGAGQTFRADHFLARFGEVQVQVRETEDGWRYWKEVSSFSGLNGESRVFRLVRDDRGAIVEFGDGREGRVPPNGHGNVRMIVRTAGFEAERMLGRSSGLPCQSFPLYGPVLEESLLLQVGRPLPGSDELVWEDWRRVEDFDRSEGHDPHFVYDPEKEEIRFGDHEKGRIPQAADVDNICLVACAYGGGSQGNIKRRLVERVAGEVGPLGELAVTNTTFAVGGRDRETLEDARKRVLEELRQPTRAVTREDYENIAQATPGLRVARVKALPLYTPGMRDYPRVKAHGNMSVVVVPYSESSTPVPSQGFLETVRNHLDRYRLISTELHVIAPLYVRVTVHAVVVTESRESVDRQKIPEVLNGYLNPLGKPGGPEGWPFGRTVYKGDIYGAITRLEGVSYIQELWLDAAGTGCRKTSGGDIEIPPHALVYSGNHDIALVSRTDL